ncbi:MAG: hypothetical protein A2W90_04955 [Bacteroidetes bacterium GWF2_42_66]|nr:MAG: hypothetical protein A2W89_21175 [Bacteroidetes bacterium GWE2_42_39]OFY40834.1 MAG: hypothetical protein A2W90_04955 [Bacteroidetes bacterium GWF2_42_66]HBL75855.1 addiction module toxin RelE [Prolixibacteraceae bacterium]HCU63104.1 addiction module toxin RelE [Prolixibacteraceae bacterium]
MRIISVKKFKDFSCGHPDSGRQLNLLVNYLKIENFENLNRVKNFFPYCSILKNNRVVLNICGNKYRAVLKFNFEMHICYVKFIDTHAEYDKINANTI